MPNTTPVTVLPGVLPYDCYPDPQTLNVDIVTRIQAFLDETFPGVYIGPTANPPTANMHNRAWFNTDSTHWYYYINGDWMRKYWPWAVPVGSNPTVEWIWPGTPAALQTFDGGDSGAVGDASGPLWEIDHELDGRTIVGAGTIPGTSPAVSIAQGAVLDSDGLEGLYKVALTPTQFQHMHGCGTDGGIDDPPNMISRAWSSVKNFVRRINDLNTSGSTGWHDDTTAFQSGTMGTTEPYQDSNYPTSDGHLNMQPYRARYVIRRTARIYVLPPY